MSKPPLHPSNDLFVIGVPVKRMTTPVASDGELAPFAIGELHCGHWVGIPFWSHVVITFCPQCAGLDV